MVSLVGNDPPENIAHTAATEGHCDVADGESDTTLTNLCYVARGRVMVRIRDL
jgi:hypothetical protein